MTCDARIRPFPDDTEVVCDLEGKHDHHLGTLRDYAYPGSTTTIQWDEADRRTFHGPWPGPCEHPMCSLHKRHRGDHVE